MQSMMMPIMKQVTLCVLMGIILMEAREFLSWNHLEDITISCCPTLAELIG